VKSGRRIRSLLAALAITAVAACLDAPPPSTDAGSDPAVSACCWKLFEGPSAVRACMRELSDEGQCRWLQCLGGLVTFEACR
jgi:hypothetical protein